MIKNKLYSVMDEEGNLGYYLYNESTGEEKLFSVVEEEERLYARGVNMRNLGKGLKKVNKAAKKTVEANTPLGTMGIKDTRVFRRVNSPMAMQNGTWIKDMGANELHTMISRKGGNAYLGRLAGGSGKAIPGWEGRVAVGGGYHAPKFVK